MIEDRFMNSEDREYKKEFGHIPDDQEGRIKMILGKRADDKKFNESIVSIAKKIKRMPHKTLKFTMWKLVKPAARPRFARRGGYIKAYVPRAKQNGDWFREFAMRNNLPLIDTPCIVNIKVYQKTPSSWSIKKKVLAELGIIRPWNNTGDYDNYSKAVADMIQHGMLSDDKLAYAGTTDRYYSIKPHAEVEVIYMTKFPEI